MCGHHKPAISRPDEDLAEFLAGAPKRPAARRLALWEIDAGMQCSIIGTCLGDDDLIAMLQKHNLRIVSGARSYDIHSYCVRAAEKESPFSRSLNKLLDRRYAGAVRIIGRAETEEEIVAAWERMRDSGQIAGAYWAIMSHRHVPPPVRVQAFGDVHMLSHLNGHGATQLAVRLAAAERVNAELEGKLRRAEQAKREALQERDAARAEASLSARAPAGGSRLRERSPANPHIERKLAKFERALVSARARARAAESALAALQAKRSQPPDGPARAASPSPALSARADANAAEALSGAGSRRRILYIGGRAAVVPHLREVAASRETEFVHHDGGIEDNLHRIEQMIEGCDAVVCPVDCISHGACRLAKALCQRLNKKFMPISTASRSGFERALEQLSFQSASASAAPAGAERGSAQ